MLKIEREKINCLHRPCLWPAHRGNTEYTRTQKSSDSLIRFRCSNSCFLLETGIAGHQRLLLAKWHPKAEKKLRRPRPFFDIADRHKQLYGRSRLCGSAQGSHKTGGVQSLFSRVFPLTFQWKTACRGDLQWSEEKSLRLQNRNGVSNRAAAAAPLGRPRVRTKLRYAFFHTWRASGLDWHQLVLGKPFFFVPSYSFRPNKRSGKTPVFSM